LQLSVEPTEVPRSGPPRPLASLGRMLPVAAAAVLLAACAVIPAQPVTDPLGLDSKQLALSFEAAAGPTAAEIGPQAVTGTAFGTIEFEDWDLELPVNPGTLSNEVSIASAALSPANSADAPEQITLSAPVLTVRVWHGAASYELAAADDRVEHVLEATNSITLSRGICALSGSCSYSYDGEALAFGTIKFSGAPLGNLLSIATQAPTPNLGSVELSVQGEPDGLAGKTLTVKLAALEGSVGF